MVARVTTFPPLESPPRVWFPSVTSARGSLLIILAIMSTPNRDWDVAIENIEHSFGSRLVLTSREHVGVVIGFSVVSDSFIGYTFSHIWKGKKDVLIKEIDSNRFCVFFVSARDHKRVLDMEPWVYRCSLILLAEILDDGSMHSMPLAHGTIWVQLHSVRGFCMMVAFA